MALVLKVNKNHSAGVTYLKEISEHMILTGSYDCTLKLWDNRNIKKEVECLNTKRQVWDINFCDPVQNKANGNKYEFAIAGVYDGYQFCKLNENAAGRWPRYFSLNDYEIDVYEGHKSICYAS